MKMITSARPKPALGQPRLAESGFRSPIIVTTTTMTGAGAATGMGMAITTGHMIGVGMMAGIVVTTTTIDVPISEYSQDSQMLSLIPSTAVYPPFSMS